MKTVSFRDIIVFTTLIPISKERWCTLTLGSTQEQASCTGKAKLAPQRAKDLVKQQNRRQETPRNAYPCPFKCKLEDGTIAYHIGSVTKARPQRRR